MKMEKEMKNEIVEKYMQSCGSSLQELKQAVARMSIDMTPTGVMEQEYDILVRCVNGHKPVLSYYPREGDDVLLNHYRCWFKFPMFYFKDMVEEDGEGFFVTLPNGQVRRIDQIDLFDWLVEELIVNNYGDFLITYWKPFLQKFQKWIMEMD
jgi:hypothetical protein